MFLSHQPPLALFLQHPLSSPILLSPTVCPAVRVIDNDLDCGFSVCVPLLLLSSLLFLFSDFVLFFYFALAYSYACDCIFDKKRSILYNVLMLQALNAYCFLDIQSTLLKVNLPGSYLYTYIYASDVYTSLYLCVFVWVVRVRKRS